MSTKNPDMEAEIKLTGRRYDSFEDFLANEFSPKTVKGVNELLEKSKLTRTLELLRTKAGISQTKMGSLMNPPCSQAKISKLENGPDANLTLHEISEYYRILKVPLVLTIGKMTISERCQYYQKQLSLVVDDAEKLAAGDRQMERGVEKMVDHAPKPSLRRKGKRSAIKVLPSSIQVEIVGRVAQSHKPAELAHQEMAVA